MNRLEPGLLEALTRLGGSLFDMLRHRLELASLELGEAGGRLVITIASTFAAVLLFGGAVAALSAWAAVALWGTLGPAVLGGLALVYALAGALVLWWLRKRMHGGPTLLEDTLAELRSDAAFMHGQTAPPREADRP